MSRTYRRRTALALVPALAFALAATAGPALATGRAHGHGHHQPGHHDKPPSWQEKPTGSAAQFRGLDAVSRDVAWLGGSDGSVLRTVDGGRHWRDVSPADSTGLLFRDVEAFDRDHALVLAIGEGEASRVYRTDDGGRTWSRTFTNTDPAAFYDCMAFFDHKRGLAMSDPVDGKFRIIATDDGGRTWSVTPSSAMPDAVDGEFGFAASGTCLTTSGHRDAWFGTGGTAARVFHSRDGGRSWQVAPTPVRSSPAGAGIFSLAFRDTRHSLAIGGDFNAPAEAVDALALTDDGGATWRLVPASDAPSGYRSGSAWVPRAGHTVLAVGPSGSDVSRDGGATWTQFDDGSFDSVECARDGACWASGAAGRVARLATGR
jgi:photosystem II stability/assembly factor-like uncharacterized protein